MQPTATDVTRSMVCVSVCVTMYRAKMAELIEMLLGIDSGGRALGNMNYMGVNIPMEKAIIGDI